MARLSKEQWEQLKADYVTGVYNVSALAKKYGITHTAINKRVKKEDWKKIDDDDLRELAQQKKVSKCFKKKVSKVSKEVKVSEVALDEKIEEIVDVAILLEKNAQKLLSKQTQMMEEMEDSDDLLTHSRVIKNLADAFKTDTKVQINNTNAQQNNTLRVEWID